VSAPDVLLDGAKTDEIGVVDPNPEGFVPIPKLVWLRFKVLVRP
jgi:hypothetical protein